MLIREKISKWGEHGWHVWMLKGCLMGYWGFTKVASAVYNRTIIYKNTKLMKQKGET